MIIQKISFRDQVKDLLIQEIIDGNILTGQKLSLVELSKKWVLALLQFEKH